MVSGPLLALITLLCVQRLDGLVPSHSTLDGGVRALWNNVATGAAQATLKAIEKNSNLRLVLKDVPLDKLQLFVGRQHQLGLEVEGVSYEVSLGNEGDLRDRAKALPLRDASGSAKQGDATGLVAHDWWNQQHHSLELPEITLSGPIELVLPEPSHVSFYTPNSVDVGAVRRITVDAGATVRITGIKSITLRRPVDLPPLPGQYLAEVHAQAKLGQPEEGFGNAPGILYMANELKRRALNSTTSATNSAQSAGSSGRKQGSSTSSSKKAVQAPPFLVSFHVEPASPGSVSLSSAPAVPGEGVSPRLKVRKAQDGTVEVTVRQGQLATAKGFSLAALTHVWAWPLPHLAMANWVPYEALLRSVLSAHPFDLDKVIKSGINMRLTKSSLRGVNLIAFEMEALGSEPVVPEHIAGSTFKHNPTPLEIWEAVVQVQQKQDGSFEYLPLHVRRKQSYRNTLTFSDSTLEALVFGNSSVPLGFESD